jgi:DNA-binding HxlR family transcriptional regulator
VLANELKGLEQDEFLKRTVVEDYPVKISYSLEVYTDTLTPIIYLLKDWGLNHKKKIFNTV